MPNRRSRSARSTAKSRPDAPAQPSAGGVASGVDSGERTAGTPTEVPTAPGEPTAEVSGEVPTRLMEQLEREEITGETHRRVAGGAPPPPAGIGDTAEGIALGTGLIARQPVPEPGDAIAVLKVCPHCGAEYETDARFCPKDGAALRPKGGTDPLVGTILADRYHILKTVGEGGMGRVYLAEHVRMNRQCAVKVMRATLVHDADAAARFGREASSAARILHPNVAAVFDFGETDGLVYLVMEYVDGEGLSVILAREQRLDPARAVDIARQVADGLAAAHELGIVHRDLKPDNIIVSRAKSGREIPKVVDFGIAKAVAEGPTETLTRSGFVIGTPEFMSPEQLLGDPVDARSDIYSLGCILYLMLVGVPAADAPTREAMLKRRLREAPPHPMALDPSIPEALDAIVVRMLATTPSERFASAAELRDALDALHLGGGARTVTGETTGESPAGGPATEELPRSWPVAGTFWPSTGESATLRRRRWIAAAGVAVLAVGVGTMIRNRGSAEANDGASTTAAGASAAASTVSTLPGLSTGARPAPGSVVPMPATPRTPRPVGATPAGTAASRTTASRTPTSAGASSDSRAGTTRTPGPSSDPLRRGLVEAAGRYARAVESRQLDQVTAVYPELTGDQRANLEKLFRDTERISAQMSAGSFTADPGGGTATLDFTLVLTMTPSGSSETIRSTRQHRATLRREQGRWVIRRLLQQP